MDKTLEALFSAAIDRRNHAPKPIQLEKFTLALLTWKIASPEVFQMPTRRGRNLPPTS